MNTKLLKASASIVWAAVAISSATPVNATAYTAQTGSYAACSTSSVYQPTDKCWDGEVGRYDMRTTYVQQIKFVNSTCNTGGCTYLDQTVYTDMVYSAGRKITTSLGLVCNVLKAYNLGACSC